MFKILSAQFGHGRSFNSKIFTQVHTQNLNSFGVISCMLFQREDIIRAAKSMILDYGELAEEEAERRIANNKYRGRSETARLWGEVKIAINKINSEIDIVAEKRRDPE